MFDNLFTSVNTLQKGLDTAWMRNEVISNNIANVDTPGFKASQVEFEDIMAAALGAKDGELQLEATDDQHITGAVKSVSDVSPRVVTNVDTSAGYDENNVNIENEMVELAKNSIDYYTLVSKVNSEFRKLNTAIDVT
jgi:flagellar basal-body rod protein FlgB